MTEISHPLKVNRSYREAKQVFIDERIRPQLLAEVARIAGTDDPSQFTATQINLAIRALTFHDAFCRVNMTGVAYEVDDGSNPPIIPRQKKKKNKQQ